MWESVAVATQEEEGMDKSLKLEIEDLEERIAPTFLSFEGIDGESRDMDHGRSW